MAINGPNSFHATRHLLPRETPLWIALVAIAEAFVKVHHITQRCPMALMISTSIMRSSVCRRGDRLQRLRGKVLGFQNELHLSTSRLWPQTLRAQASDVKRRLSDENQ